jgi:oligopeptide/dipeptide ABC transporter ATP-binding protein
MRLISSPPGRILPQSKVRVDGRDVLALSESKMQAIRGRDIAMIFQDAMTALNPVFTVGNLLSEVLKRHQNMSPAAARARATELMRLVGIPEPQKRLNQYPHQLSGGMRQRTMIAMALSCNPKILIADEPTTALDVTIQAQILALITKLQKEIGMATIFITHDLAVVAEVCDRVAVMYCGRIVEEGGVEDIFARPRHPYTKGLLNSIPKLGEAHGAKLETIPGMVPDLLHLPPGCRFADRCFAVQDKCSQELPTLQALSDTRKTSCFFPLGDVS